jgi:hypothetical protein
MREGWGGCERRENQRKRPLARRASEGSVRERKRMSLLARNMKKGCWRTRPLLPPARWRRRLLARSPAPPPIFLAPPLASVVEQL